MNTSVSLPEVLTLEQVADFFQVSRTTVLKLIQRGDIPAIREGKNYKVLRADIFTYLESLRQGKQGPKMA